MMKVPVIYPVMRGRNQKSKYIIIIWDVTLQKKEMCVYSASYLVSYKVCHLFVGWEIKQFFYSCLSHIHCVLM